MIIINDFISLLVFCLYNVTKIVKVFFPVNKFLILCFSPIIEEERTVFQFDYPQAKVTPVYTNESDAINRLLDGKAWLAFAARDFKASELQNLQARNFRPVSIKVAYDALALFTMKAKAS